MGITGLKVRVDSCDVRRMPQFLSLVDLGGVVYPIRVHLDDEEELALLKASCSESRVQVADRSGRNKTYAGMVRKQWRECSHNIYTGGVGGHATPCQLLLLENRKGLI